ncbi:N-acetyl sugar amidotransferase [Bacterioplanoides sp.]|uniref:N-acetyl sugar amidotransferase n=1 Tax=Bacterioplanoides sp. TaxID=2066072 RepID=UPI003AFF8182
MSVNTMQSCKRCLYQADHALGLVIDDQGICSGCRIHEEKDALDWQHRWSLLEQLVQPYRSSDTRHYDCIVPVTGAQDSYYILHLVKNRLKMNPLLVTYNKYWNTPLGIRNLANLRIKFNCDIVIQNVNPLAVKKITKETLRKFGSLYWHCLSGQTVFPVQTAVRYQIPLIIWGAHQGMEQVGMFSHEHEVEMTRRYRKDHDLMGHEADDLLSVFNTLTEGDIWQYRYPDDHSLNRVGVRGIYLNNYVRWDPLAQHKKMVDLYDYQGASFNRTFDTYDHVDCYNYMDLHDRIKGMKCGYSKVTDQLSREIRHGRISRDQALIANKFYGCQSTKYEDLLLDWLDIDQAGLEFVLHQFDQEKQSDGENNRDYSLGEVTELLQEATQLSMDRKDQYITIGKGIK